MKLFFFCVACLLVIGCNRSPSPPPEKLPSLTQWVELNGWNNPPQQPRAQVARVESGLSIKDVAGGPSWGTLVEKKLGQGNLSKYSHLLVHVLEMSGERPGPRSGAELGSKSRSKSSLKSAGGRVQVSTRIQFTPKVKGRATLHEHSLGYLKKPGVHLIPIRGVPNQSGSVSLKLRVGPDGGAAKIASLVWIPKQPTNQESQATTGEYLVLEGMRYLIVHPLTAPDTPWILLWGSQKHQGKGPNPLAIDVSSLRNQTINYSYQGSGLVVFRPLSPARQLTGKP